MTVIFSAGHPNSYVSEVLPQASTSRVFNAVIDKGTTGIESSIKLQFKHLKTLTDQEIVSAASGRGVCSDTISDLKVALNKFRLWLLEPGTEVPFNEKKTLNFKNKKTLHEMKMDLEKDSETDGIMLTLQNKHASALELILKNSDHPCSNEILSLWKDDLARVEKHTLIQDAPLIQWKESKGGYSIISTESRFNPCIDVYARWDAVVLNNNVTLIQTNHQFDGVGSEVNAYLNIDENPTFLCECSFDFQLTNLLIIKKLKLRYPDVKRYSVCPDNTDIVGYKSPMIGKESEA